MDAKSVSERIVRLSDIEGDELASMYGMGRLSKSDISGQMDRLDQVMEQRAHGVYNCIVCGRALKSHNFSVEHQTRCAFCGASRRY